MLIFHGLHLSLALHFGFEARLTVGVDRLFGKIVSSAAGCVGYGLTSKPKGESRRDSTLHCRLQNSRALTDAEGAPANPVKKQKVCISLVVPDVGSAPCRLPDARTDAHQVDLIWER